MADGGIDADPGPPPHLAIEKPCRTGLAEFVGRADLERHLALAGRVGCLGGAGHCLLYTSDAADE